MTSIAIICHINIFKSIYNSETSYTSKIERDLWIIYPGYKNHYIFYSYLRSEVSANILSNWLYLSVIPIRSKYKQDLAKSIVYRTIQQNHETTKRIQW